MNIFLNDSETGTFFSENQVLLCATHGLGLSKIGCFELHAIGLLLYPNTGVDLIFSKMNHDLFFDLKTAISGWTLPNYRSFWGLASVFLKFGQSFTALVKEWGKAISFVTVQT